MFVATWIELDWRTSRVLARRGYNYFGPVVLLKGASPQETSIANMQQGFYQNLFQNYQQQFANQTSILKSLTQSFQPILSAGINQFGYSPAEEAALRTRASEGTASIYGQAARALGQETTNMTGTLGRGPGGAGSVASGGETYIPSGQVGYLQAGLAGKAAQQEAAQQLGITTSGYDIGRQNYLQAANLLGGVASQYNPVPYANAGTAAGENAFKSADTVAKENAAASPWSMVGGLLGGVAGSFLGPIGSSLGSKVGSMIGGGGGSAIDAGLPSYMPASDSSISAPSISYSMNPLGGYMGTPSPSIPEAPMPTWYSPTP